MFFIILYCTGETRNGTISLSNYRLYVSTNPGFVNIPLGLIEQVPTGTNEGTVAQEFSIIILSNVSATSRVSVTFVLKTVELINTGTNKQCCGVDSFFGVAPAPGVQGPGADFRPN